jgi:hypothetical protein
VGESDHTPMVVVLNESVVFSNLVVELDKPLLVTDSLFEANVHSFEAINIKIHYNF